MKLIIIVSVLAVVLIAGCSQYFVQEEKDFSKIDFYSCMKASDCVPVDCGGGCSGGGGFPYDEIINKKYVNEWYQKNTCDEPGVGLTVTCPRMLITCENSTCGVKVAFCEPPEECWYGAVDEIIDGDTVIIKNKPVRLALVDAPEYDNNGWEEAKEFISSLCPLGSGAIVDPDDGQTEGSYGRDVGIVYCYNGDGKGYKNVNLELVENNLAIVDKYYCNVSEFAGEEWTGC